MGIEEYGKFSHLEKIFTDFGEICEEIQNQTDVLAGSNKGICDKQITLKIFSKNVLTLTLVDLPGFTKVMERIKLSSYEFLNLRNVFTIFQVPVGDQPEDIEQQIKELAMKYITNPNSIILAVTAANTDIATSEGLKFAKEVDPEGERTLAVLTKLDLMDRGTDANDMLEGRVIPVKLGIIGVVNRSQQDINDKVGIAESLKSEAIYLKKHYPMLAEINGTHYLSKVLHQLLINHIHENLPNLRDRVRAKMLENENLLEEYGEEVVDKGRTLIQIITKFSDVYNSSIEGNIKNLNSSDCLGCGAEIYCICFDVYKSFLDELDPVSELNDMDIWKAAKYASGTEPPIFVCEDSFKLMIRNQLKKFKEPTIMCLEMVHDKMRDLIQDCCKSELKLEMERFPKLNSKFLNLMTSILREFSDTTKKMLEHQLDMEKTYINTQHEDFRKSLRELEKRKEEEKANKSKSPSIQVNNIYKAVFNATPRSKDMIKKRMESHKLSAEEKQEIEDIKYLIEVYYDIVKKKFLDSVPKTIMHFLVYATKSQVQKLLIHQLCMNENYNELLLESDRLSIKRKQANEMLTVIFKLFFCL